MSETVYVLPDDDAAMVFVLQGEIDLSTAGDLRYAADLALRSGYSALVVDASGVSFMDSQGIRALILADRTMSEAGGSLSLRQPAPAVRKVLDLTGVDRVITVEG